MEVVKVSSHITRKRAHLSGKATDVLEARTLVQSHKRLADLLKKGMTVLDVGCGTGTITRDIAEMIGPNGRVVGLDSNPALIERARQLYNGIPGLSFEIGDIYSIHYKNTFDIVTAARVLQWLDRPEDALLSMKSAAKYGGKILVLDYNHEKIKWTPEPPASMQSFYRAFLSWRSTAHMDNAIADHLVELYQRAGIKKIVVTPQHEVVNRSDNHFQQAIRIWTDVAESRGLQMVADGFVNEKMRICAVKEYEDWIERVAFSQKMYLLAVEGIKEP